MCYSMTQCVCVCSGGPEWQVILLFKFILLVSTKSFHVLEADCYYFFSQDHSLKQGSGTYGSRAKYDSSGDGIWLADNFQ